MNITALKPIAGSHVPAVAEWWRDQKMVSLVKRTAFKDCNDTEFDEAVAVSRELKLSPLRKQIYAFVFSKDDPAKRNMVLVVGIDGARAVAARTGRYRPDNRAPRFTTDDRAKNEASNPLGLVSVEVSAFLFSNGEWHEIVGIAYWDEFAPITKGGNEDDYEWKETNEVYPEGHKKAGQKKFRKVLRSGATAIERLDPKKDGWRKSARHMLAKCAEMIALRKGWPEDLSRVYAEEETHRGQVIDAEYTDLTPTEMASAAEASKRQDLLGGRALFATFDETGTLERVPIGQFADKMLAVTERMPANQVAALVERNREALNEFWAYNKTDALALKKELERRSAGGVVQSSATAGSPLAALIDELKTLKDNADAFEWSKNNQARIAALSPNDRKTFDLEFLKRQGEFSRAFAGSLEG